MTTVRSWLLGPRGVALLASACGGNTPSGDAGRERPASVAAAATFPPALVKQ